MPAVRKGGGGGGGDGGGGAGGGGSDSGISRCILITCSHMYVAMLWSSLFYRQVINHCTHTSEYRWLVSCDLKPIPMTFSNQLKKSWEWALNRNPRIVFARQNIWTLNALIWSLHHSISVMLGFHNLCQYNMNTDISLTLTSIPEENMTFWTPCIRSRTLSHCHKLKHNTCICSSSLC